LELSYDFGGTQVLACLFGPSECRIGSKQDHTKGIIEVNLRLPPDSKSDSAAKAEMRADLRSCLEQIIHGFSYPK
jgi:ribonuclease PH